VIFKFAPSTQVLQALWSAWVRSPGRVLQLLEHRAGVGRESCARSTRRTRGKGSRRRCRGIRRADAPSPLVKYYNLYYHSAHLHSRSIHSSQPTPNAHLHFCCERRRMTRGDEMIAATAAALEALRKLAVAPPCQARDCRRHRSARLTPRNVPADGRPAHGVAPAETRRPHRRPCHARR